MGNLEVPNFLGTEATSIYFSSLCTELKSLCNHLFLQISYEINIHGPILKTW